MIHGSIDSVLRGAGMWGAVVATLKNMAIKRFANEGKDWNADPYAVMAEALQVSPPLGIKARKLVQAERDLIWKKSLIDEMETFDIENPLWSAYTSHTEGLTNIPLNRLYNKTMNVRESLNNQHHALDRVLMFSGWSRWNLGLGDSEKIEEVKKTIKEKKKEASKVKKEENKQIKLREKYPGKTDGEIKEIIKLKEKNKEVFDLNKKEQIKILEANGLNPKDYSKEQDRVNAIMNLHKKDEGKIDSTLAAVKNYVPTEEEQVSIELFKMTKKDQVNLLMELGISTKVIKSLKYEEDRVKKIIELQKKVKKAKNK
jgi:hypothetical protein